MTRERERGLDGDHFNLTISRAHLLCEDTGSLYDLHVVFSLGKPNELNSAHARSWSGPARRLPALQ